MNGQGSEAPVVQSREEDEENSDDILAQRPDREGEESPTPIPAEPQINIKVVDSMGGELFMKIRMNTPMRKLFRAYSMAKGTDANAVRFMFDGQRLDADDTPHTLDMEDGDAIDALAQQVGGGWQVKT